MAPRCQCCASDYRHAIDQALVAGLSCREVGERFDIDFKAVHRHSTNHLTVTQRAAIATATAPSDIDPEQLAKREGSNLLSHVAAQRVRLMSDADTCRMANDMAGAIAAEKALAHTLVITGKLVGQFTTRIAVTHTHALLDPRWLSMRAAIVDALRPHPDALRAVIAAVQAAEQATADAITGPALPPPAPVIDAEWTEAIPPCPVPAP